MFLHSSHENNILGRLVHELFEGLPGGEKTAEFATHFVVDTVNIVVLLFVVMFCVFFIQTYVSTDKLQHKLAGLKSIWGYVLAVLIGVVSPFCSCSIVPVLMGLIAMGVPIPVCLCMLTAASLVNLTAVTALFTLTGMEYTTIYLGCALAIIAVSSLLLSRLNLANGIQEYGLAHCHGHEHDMDSHEAKGRASLAFHSTWHVFQKAWIYILLGVALSAGIEAFFPMEAISSAVSSNTVLSTTVAALIGFPIHSDVFTIMPILHILREIYPPVSMTFTLSTMVISVPGVVMLSRVLKPKVIGIYVGILASLTLAAGFVLIPFL